MVEMIRYIDFNNNVYTIRKTSIHYSPMKPENSSSGTYSGGEASDTPITEDQFKHIAKIASSIINNKNLHLKTRRMLTAMLYVTAEGETEKCTISKSTAHSELVKMLRDLIN
jgi:hypothetical protein